MKFNKKLKKMGLVLTWIALAGATTGCTFPENMKIKARPITLGVAPELTDPFKNPQVPTGCTPVQDPIYFAGDLLQRENPASPSKGLFLGGLIPARDPNYSLFSTQYLTTILLYPAVFNSLIYGTSAGSFKTAPTEPASIDLAIAPVAPLGKPLPPQFNKAWKVSGTLRLENQALDQIYSKLGDVPKEKANPCVKEIGISLNYYRKDVETVGDLHLGRIYLYINRSDKPGITQTEYVSIN